MEEIKVSGAKLLERLKAIVKEGNVRRVVLRNPEGRVLLDVPLIAVLGRRGERGSAGDGLHHLGRARPDRAEVLTLA